MNKIRVMLVEDDPEWQRGISDFFEGHPRIDIVRRVSGRADCLAALTETNIDVVLMDIMLGEQNGNGLDATLDVTVEYPAVKVIIVSSIDNDDEVFYEAFLSGAYDYIYKNDFEQLPHVIAESMEKPTSKYGDRLRKLVFDKKKELITEYDAELLLHIAQGLTQQEIAQINSVSLAAVKKQVGRLLEKFNWSGSSKELADKCLKWGLINR